MVSSEYQTYDVTCQSCGMEYNIIAKEQDVFDWLSGEKYIQDALEYLSSAERELFISQTCNTCWNLLYPDTEEVGDE